MSWRYCLQTPFSMRSGLLDGVSFENEWVTIRDGAIIIAAGYAWDGCSPAVPVGWVWLGPWDGPLCPDGRPAAFYASLVHDVLCQFAQDIPISQKATVALFDTLLRQHNFPPLLRPLYAWAVDRFGPQDFGSHASS